MIGEPVSRETPPVPEAARGVFGVRLPLAVEYAALLAREGDRRGLIGPREVPRLWQRHLLNCAVVTEVIAEGASVADIGSGAGLPGVVIAIRRPDLSVTLIEPMARRTEFLHHVVVELGLDNVTVCRGRAEEIGRRSTGGDRHLFQVVTSRAVAPLDRLARWSLPLVAEGGAMLAMKGSSAAQEVEDHQSAVGRAGGGTPEIIEVGMDVLQLAVRLIRVKRRGANG